MNARIERLKRDPQDELAQALAARYMRDATKSASNLSAWYVRVKPYPYLTDIGGYVWRVDEAALKASRPRARRGDIHVPRPATAPKPR